MFYENKCFMKTKLKKMYCACVRLDNLKLVLVKLANRTESSRFSNPTHACALGLF